MPVVFFVGALFLLHFFVARSLAAIGGGAEKKLERELSHYEDLHYVWLVSGGASHSDASDVWVFSSVVPSVVLFE